MGWQWISVVADILGVGMDAISFIDRYADKGKERDPLKLLCIMHGPTAAWKEIHL